MTIPTIGAGFLSVRLEEQTKLLDDSAYPTPIGLVGWRQRQLGRVRGISELRLTSILWNQV